MDIVGDVTALTVNADGDTSAGDNAAMGYTATEGLILTGQGSTNDVTIKNDADTAVISIPTGGTGVTFAGVTTHGGNIVSDTDSTDDLGTTSVRWANLYVDSIGDAGQALTFAGSSMSFSDNNITNVGDIALDSITSDAGTTITINQPIGVGNAPASGTHIEAYSTTGGILRLSRNDTAVALDDVYGAGS